MYEGIGLSKNEDQKKQTNDLLSPNGGKHKINKNSQRKRSFRLSFDSMNPNSILK